MKKIVVVMTMLIGITVLAQKGEKHHRDAMEEMSPEQIATLKTKKATLALDLTEAQQTQMKAVFTEEAEMRKANMAERKALKEKGEKKNLTTEERYAKANERLDYQIAQKEKVAAILSDAQMEKWEKMKHRRSKHRRGRGRKGNAPQKKQKE